MNIITEKLFELQDIEFKSFESKLIPNIDEKSIIGVRTPILKKYAKQIKNTDIAMDFINTLPHEYFEENQLHAFIINEIKDFNECIFQIEKFLPYIDNWATCDQLNPKILKENPDKLVIKIKLWIQSSHTYTIRYAIKKLMDFYLDENFRLEYLEIVAKIRSQEYYVNMMIAWFFAESLVRQWESTIVYLTERRLPDWVHRKTIQKACESFRISDDKKMYLKTLK